jgi:hypothetical protein
VSSIASPSVISTVHRRRGRKSADSHNQAAWHADPAATDPPVRRPQKSEARRPRDAIAGEIKPVYTAPFEQAALDAFAEVDGVAVPALRRGGLQGGHARRYCP